MYQSKVLKPFDQQSESLDEICGQLQDLTNRLSAISKGVDGTSHEPLPVSSPDGVGSSPISLHEDVWSGASVTERQVERLIRLRQARLATFPRVLFGDPAWDILLHLMLAFFRNESVYTGNLAPYTRIDDATLHETLEQLESAGLIACVRDPTDPRHILVHLTDQSAQRLARMFQLF
jgi:DNA-binding MarR family transcriptional regulator